MGYQASRLSFFSVINTSGAWRTYIFAKKQIKGNYGFFNGCSTDIYDQQA